MVGWVESWMDGETDKWVERRKDGWETVGWLERQTDR